MEEGTPLSRQLVELKERAGAELDYALLIMAETATVLNCPLGSQAREYSLSDLHNLLGPFQDEPFNQEWKKMQDIYSKRIPEHGLRSQAATWQRERFRLLVRLMKRKGILPMGMI